MKTILLLPLSLFLFLGNLHAQPPVGCCSSADDGEAVTIKGSRANTTDYYIDGLRVQYDQCLTAEVIDQEKGDPVYFANVRLYREEELISGAVVDETGFFTINGREGDVVEISHISYGKKSFPFEELITDPIVQMKTGMDLEEVVVLADALESVIECRIICGFTAIECFSINREELVVSRTEELNGEASWAWSYFPNPTQENVFVQTGENKGDILLYSMEGRLISQQTIQSTGELITLAGLPSATYFLVYNGDEEQGVIGQVVLID